MDKPNLSKYFKGVIAKRLSEVEVVSKKSNQREFNSTSAMKALLGKSKASFSTEFIYLCDDSVPVKAEGFATWYDAREKNPLRSEYRLFYKRTDASDLAQAGDSLFLCRRAYSLLAVFTKAGSMMERRMNCLFGISPSDEFEAGVLKVNDSSCLLVENSLLELIGVKTEDDTESLAKMIRGKYKGTVPSFDDLCSFARAISGVTPEKGSADDVFIAWMNSQAEVMSAVKKCLSDFRTCSLAGDIKDKIAYDKVRTKVMGNWYDSVARSHLKALLKSRNLSYEPSIRAGKDMISLPDMREKEAGTVSSGQMSELSSWFMLNVETFKLPENTMVNYMVTMDPGLTAERIAALEKRKIQPVIPSPVQKLYNGKNVFWFLSVEELLLLLTEKQEGRYGN